MLRFHNVTKYFRTPGGRKTVLEDFSQVLPTGGKVALIGRNGAGKSTMISMIAGKTSPNAGWIESSGLVSWPLGLGGSFANDLSGTQNTRFVARIYGIDTDYLLDYVQDFTQLGDYLNMPVRTYSSGMRARLAFGLSMGLSFDWYLVDEITSVGDSAFRKKSSAVFRTRLAKAGLIMVSHSVGTLQEYCTSAIVLDRGQARYFPDLAEALDAHAANMATEV
jgi:capsular polysaccharide transport system ATP-binding protein